MKAKFYFEKRDSDPGNPSDRLWSLIQLCRFSWLFFAVMLACFFNEGHAQALVRTSARDPMDLSLEELINLRVDRVFSASKYEQKVTQAPASVSIVTAEEFSKFGYRTLGDALRGMRGFYISNDRTYSYVGSQGFQRPGDFNTRYLFLVDGHRMNDNIFTAGSVGTEGLVDVDLIDRLEVIRGPSSSIYGNNAFLGVINIITKTGQQIDGVEGSVEGGSFGTHQERFVFGKKFGNDIEWLFSASSFASDGQTNLYYPEFDQRISSDPRARNNGVAKDSDREESQRFYTSVTYHDFTLTGMYYSRVKDVPTAPFGAFFGEPSRFDDQRKYVELKYSHLLGDGTELSGRLSYDVFPHIGRLPYDYTGSQQPADIVDDYDGDFGDWFTMEAQVKRRLFERHTLIVGAEYQENLTQHLFNYDSDGTTFIDDLRKGRSVAAFSQVEASLRSDLLLNAGLRYDHFDTFGSTLNPRVGLIYNPMEQATLKLLYGRAFRAPNDYELYYGSPAYGQVANPDLRPETIQTYEIVYEQYLPAYLRFSASAYHYEITNLVSQTLQPDTNFLIFANLDRVETQGVDFELEGKYPNGVRARASYTLQRTENEDTGEELTNSPRHLIKGNLILPLYRDKVFAGVELQYQSAIKLLSGRREKDYVVGNLTLLSKSFVRGLEVSAGVYNFLDTAYASPGSGGLLQDTVPQDGRSFRFKVTYKY